MILTVLATELADAVKKDEQSGQEGLDISAGKYGDNVTEWLKGVSEQVSGEDRAKIS